MNSIVQNLTYLGVTPRGARLHTSFVDDFFPRFFPNLRSELLGRVRGRSLRWDQKAVI